jgi:hypothetical protein
MPETPEQRARREIDAKLIASGWLVQDRDDLDLTAGRGIAVREFPMKSGFVVPLQCSSEEGRTPPHSRRITTGSA